MKNLLKKVRNSIAIRFAGSKNPVKRIVSFWEKDGPDFEYFEKADSKEWLDVYWNPGSRFYKLMNRLDLEIVLEIACGTGRHSAIIDKQIGYLYLLDSSAGALEHARNRFSHRKKVSYIHSADGNGIPVNSIPSNSLTAVFSYDAMVHFQPETVQVYLRDSFACLKNGGFALIHHSNYDKNPGGQFTDNPGWRNYMNKELFANYANQAGFELIQSESFDFSTENSDCVTLLRKPIESEKTPVD